MLPVMGHPAVVAEFADFFHRMFSWHQFKRFKQYLTGLITGRRPTVRSIASRLVEPTDQSSLNRFLTLYRWDGDRLNRRRLELLQSTRETRWRWDGVVAIDDTLLPKTGKRMPGAGKLWDHSSGRYVQPRASSPATMWTRRRTIPWVSGSTSSTAAGRRRGTGSRGSLISPWSSWTSARRWASRRRTGVFDSWYLTQEVAKHIEAYGKGWVSRLKSNRVVYHGKRRMSISQYRETLPGDAFKMVEVLGEKLWAYTKVLDVNKLGRVRVVICYDSQDLKGDPVILVTNRLYWEERKVIKCYGLRFRIEGFYRDAKQNLGLGGCQLRSLKDTRRHWMLGVTAYSLLKPRICRSRLYRKLKADRTIGAECRQAFKDLLRNLIQWVYNKADKIHVDKILDVMLK